MRQIAEYSSADEAMIVKGMLAGYGIEAEADTNALSTIFPAPGSGTNVTRLFVADGDAKRAEELLRQHGDE